jgi:hypothetical protein
VGLFILLLRRSESDPRMTEWLAFAYLISGTKIFDQKVVSDGQSPHIRAELSHRRRSNQNAVKHVVRR